MVPPNTVPQSAIECVLALFPTVLAAASVEEILGVSLSGAWLGPTSSSFAVATSQ